MLKSGRAVKSTRVLQHIHSDSDQTADVAQGQRGSSRPEESHPRALPDPCVNLSIHTAPDAPGRFHGTAANERRASDLCGEADQTSRVLLWFLRRSRLNLRRAQRMT